MERSLTYWSEAADDPAVVAILADTDPEDPDLAPEGPEDDGDESEDDSGSASLTTPEVSDDQEEF